MAAVEATLEEITERLNPRRRHRSNPRVVKRVHVHAYKAKRRTDIGIVYDGPPDIKILAVT